MTIDEAKQLRYGQKLWVTDISGGNPAIFKVSGKPQIWKRSPNRVKVPIRHGLYCNWYVTEANLDRVTIIVSMSKAEIREHLMELKNLAGELERIRSRVATGFYTRIPSEIQADNIEVRMSEIIDQVSILEHKMDKREYRMIARTLHEVNQKFTLPGEKTLINAVARELCQALEYDHPRKFDKQEFMRIYRCGVDEQDC